MNDPRGALGASIEIPPRQVIEAPDLARLLPGGIRVYLPDLGSDDDTAFIAAARKLREIGCEPVPHLAARRIASQAALDARLAALTGEAGVRDVLVIGGGLDRPAGPFDASLPLLETGLLDRYGITEIGIAGHPEGSPDFSDDVAEAALRAKADFAERSGARLRLVTQFGFDMAPFLAWTEALAAGGLSLPVHLGLAGPTRLGPLLRYGQACGVGASMGVLRARGRSLMRLFSGYDPEALVGAIDAYRAAHPASLIAQIHVFPFGGADRSAAWLRARGSWPAIGAAQGV